MSDNESVHRLEGSSGNEKGGLVIMKKKKETSDDSAMAPPQKSMLGMTCAMEQHKFISSSRCSIICFIVCYTVPTFVWRNSVHVFCVYLHKYCDR